MALRWHMFFPSWVSQGSPAYTRLWYPLFTDKAGNISFLKVMTPGCRGWDLLSPLRLPSLLEMQQVGTGAWDHTRPALCPQRHRLGMSPAILVSGCCARDHHKCRHLKQRKFMTSHVEKSTLSTTNWHLPSTSTRIKSCVSAAADLPHPRKGIQGGEQQWGTLYLGVEGGNWQDRSLDS